MDHKIISTAVGSLPHQDIQLALELVRGTFAEAPFWPQLPKRDFREGMYIQYSEGLPGAVLDLEKQRLYFSMEATFSLPGKNLWMRSCRMIWTRSR